MDPERWHEVDRLLEAALDRSPAERPAFLDTACAGDTALRREVERLLEADEMGTGLLAGAPGELLALALGAGEEEGSRDIQPDTGPAMLSGRTVSHFRIGAPLGSGGMGVVYEAEDTRLGRPVALKFLAPELVRDPTAKARFLKEARAASALDHANLCTILEAGESEDGILFLAMPRYHGESLANRISRGPLPVEEALEIAVQAARGLTKAHEHGIFHCDVKPGNLFLTRDGVVKILDFGIVKLVGEVEPTRLGAILGTPSYMAPEQTRGELVDARADVWSLGVVLYEMIAGRRPFVGGSVAAMVHAVLQETPESLTHLRPEVPAELDRILSRMLAKDPGQRHADAAEALADLRSALGLPTTGSLNPAVSRRPRRRLVFGSLLIAFILVLVAVFALRQREQAERQALIARSRGLLAQASSLTKDQMGLKLLLLAQANRIPEPTIDAQYALASALQGAPGLLSAQDAPDSRIVAYSPDGRTLAWIDGMERLQLWSTKAHRPIRTLSKDNAFFSSIAFSPNGRILAAGFIGAHDELGVQLWEMPKGRKLGELRWEPVQVSGEQRAARRSMIFSLAFSSDGHRLAASTVEAFMLWTVETREQIGTTTPHLWPTPGIRFSPDGRYLIARGQAWSIEERKWLNGDYDIIEESTITFSKDGQLLAVGTRNGITVWTLGERRRVGEFDSHKSSIVRIAFDDQARFLAVADDAGAVRVWRIAGRQLMSSYFFRNPIWEIDFDSDASHLAVGGRDGSTSIWPVAYEPSVTPFRQTEIQGHEGPVRRLSFSHTDNKLISESRSGSRRTWSVEGMQRPPLSKAQINLPLKSLQSVLSPDGTALAWGDEKGMIRLWSIPESRLIGSPLQHRSKIFSLAFSPDGSLLASGGYGTIRLWSVAKNRLIGSLRVNATASFVALAFRSDGRLLASSESDGIVRFWSPQELTQTSEPLRTGTSPMSLVFGGPRLLIVGEQKAQLWSVEDRSRVGAPFEASEYGGAAEFSSDGQVLAVRDQEVIRIWRIPQRDLLCELRLRQRVSHGLALSPDGKTLASPGNAAFVGTIQLWSVDGCRAIGEPLRVSTTGRITAVAFSPDGRTLVSHQRSYRSPDNLILSDLDPASWRARACRIAGRNFSLEEWRELVGSKVPYECTCPDFPAAEGMTRCPSSS